jgi:hypothetical protein
LFLQWLGEAEEEQEVDSQVSSPYKKHWSLLG